MPISILLVEDHNVVRQALKMLIDADPELEVIGEAADGNAALSLAEKLVPDIMIVDLMIPKLSGLEVTRQVSKKVPETKIVILSMHSDEAYVIDALRNGAAAYLLKDASADELITALHRVSQGMRYLSPSLSDRAIESYIEQSRSATSNPYDVLTSREMEVLHLVIEGQTNSQIADQLVVSSRTVETHRANLMRKLGVKSTTDLIRHALRHRILPIE